MRKSMIIIVILAILVLATGCESAGRRLTEEETIKLGDATMISVEASSADIEIISEDREDISVVLHTYTRGPKLKVSDGKTIHIEAKRDRMIGMSFSLNYSPRLTIYVPEGYRESIEIQSSSGDLNIEEFTLDSLDIDLSSGDVRGKKLVFETGAIKSSSGDINMRDIETNQLKIRSSSGDLRLEDFKGELEGNSSSGDVVIIYKEFKSDLDYKTQSGDLTVDFNGEAIDADFDLDCNSGDVSMNFDLDDVEKEKDNEVRGTKGEGTYQVKLRASSGEITVKE